MFRLPDKYIPIKDKIKLTMTGDLLIRSDGSPEEYSLYEDMKNRYYVRNKFDPLHNHPIECRFPKKRVSNYYIPEDIFPYVDFVNDKFIERGNVPDELKEKLFKSLVIFNVDYQCLPDDYRWISKDFAVKINNRLFCKKVIITKTTNQDLISFNERYNYLANSHFFWCYEEGIKQKKELLENGYRE